MKRIVGASMLSVFCLIAALVASSSLAADFPAAAGTSVGGAQGESLTEVNKKLTNPVSEIWSIGFQQNNYVLSTIPGREDKWSSNLNFQPVMPVSLTGNWNLITRPVLPLFVSQPHAVAQAGPPGMGLERTTGFGDTIFMMHISPSPKLSGNWLLGIGPTFIFPTASTDATGQGKWQVGPSAIVGYLSQKWILGGFVQNWSSFAGDSGRPNTNLMNFQPIAAFFLPVGWSVGYSGNILANWKADSGNVWTVPLGLGVGKVVKFGMLPVKISLAAQWMPVHPDDFGQKWNFQLTLSPVIPKLLKGTLFE